MNRASVCDPKLYTVFIFTSIKSFSNLSYITRYTIQRLSRSPCLELEDSAVTLLNSHGVRYSNVLGRMGYLFLSQFSPGTSGAPTQPGKHRKLRAKLKAAVPNPTNVPNCLANYTILTYLRNYNEIYLGIRYSIYMYISDDLAVLTVRSSIE